MSPGCGGNDCGEQDAGHVAEQEPMGVERALGWAGRARRVDDDRRVVGQRVNGRERGRGGAELAGVVERPVDPATVDHDDRAQVGQALADLGHLGPVRRVGDERDGARIGQPVLDGLRAEQHEQRDGDEPGAVGRDVGDARLRRLGQEDRDPIARDEAVPGQDVRQPVRRPPDVLEGPAG